MSNTPPPEGNPGPTGRPVTKRVGMGRASAILASGTIVSRLLGFINVAVLANTIGTQYAASNTFAIANQLPNNIYALIAGGLLSAVLVPQIVRASDHGDGGEKFVNRVITLGIVVFLAIAIIATLCAPLLVHLYAAQSANGSTRGLSAQDITLATAFAYWCLPQIFFYAIYSLLGEVLNARHVFGPFTWAPLVNNVIAISGLVIFNIAFAGVNIRDTANWTPTMVAVVAGTTTLGVAGQGVFLALFWRRTGLRYRPEFRWHGVGLGSVGKAAGWTFAMILVTQLAGIVQSTIASLAGNGNPSNAVLRNAWLIFMLPHGIVTVSISTPYFTRMSADAHRGDFISLRRDVSASLRSIGLLLLFAAVALMVVALPFSAVLSKSLGETQSMAAVLVAYIAGLVPFSILFVLQRTFYALGDTRTPFFFQTFQSVLLVGGILISGTLAQPAIALGIAVSTTLANYIQTGIAAILLRRRIHGLDGRSIARSFGRYFLALLPATIAGLGMDAALGAFADGFAVHGKIAALGSIVLIGAVMGVVYFVGLTLLRTPELRELILPVTRRLRRR